MRVDIKGDSINPVNLHNTDKRVDLNVSIYLCFCQLSGNGKYCITISYFSSLI